MPKPRKISSSELQYRSLALIDEPDVETRSMSGIAATEAAVLMPDWERMEMVPEVLLMSGCQIPPSRSVPLLKDHQRQSSDAVLGSASELRVEGDQLKTSTRFSKAGSVTDTWTKVEEGHVRSLSVGYKVDKKQFVPEGRTERIAGRTFTGPVNVVTSWKVREVSVTPIGADELAVMRGFQQNPFLGGSEVTISKLTRAFLESRGLPNESDDAAVIQWLRERGMPEELGQRTVEDWIGDNLAKFTPPQRAEVPTQPQPQTATMPDIDAAVQRALEARDNATQQRLEQIRFTCDLAGHPEWATEFITDTRSIQEIQIAIKERKAQSQDNLSPFRPLQFEAAHVDKGRAAIRSALLQRTAMGCRLSDGEQLNPQTGRVESRNLRSDYVGELATGWQDFQYAGLLDMARACLEIDGIQTRRFSNEQVAKAALGFNLDQLGMRSGTAFHFTASFTNLTLDAINKSMLIGYQEYPFTWRRVFRQAPSVKDFKNINRMRVSAVENLDIWPDGKKPLEGTMTDQKVSYRVEAYAKTLSFSWRLLVNDDMDVLSDAPMKLGNAAARTQNAHVWSIITSNPTMPYDSVALFSNTSGTRLQDNTTTGVINVANLGLARSLMRLMRGMNTKQGAAGADILNLEPRILVVPATIETTAQQTLQSIYDPAVNTTNVFNPFRGLELVVEPLLDDTSTAEWYLFASPSQITVAEMTFLEGQETPRTNDWTDNETWARKYMIAQSYQAQAIDHRGAIKSTGS